jgi:hypothetical protein
MTPTRAPPSSTSATASDFLRTARSFLEEPGLML